MTSNNPFPSPAPRGSGGQSVVLSPGICTHPLMTTFSFFGIELFVIYSGVRPRARAGQRATTALSSAASGRGIAWRPARRPTRRSASSPPPPQLLALLAGLRSSAPRLIHRASAGLGVARRSPPEEASSPPRRRSRRARRRGDRQSRGQLQHLRWSSATRSTPRANTSDAAVGHRASGWQSGSSEPPVCDRRRGRDRNAGARPTRSATGCSSPGCRPPPGPPSCASPAKAVRRLLSALR